MEGEFGRRKLVHVGKTTERTTFTAKRRLMVWNDERRNPTAIHDLCELVFRVAPPYPIAHHEQRSVAPAKAPSELIDLCWRGPGDRGFAHQIPVEGSLAFHGT